MNYNYEVRNNHEQCVQFANSSYTDVYPTQYPSKCLNMSIEYSCVRYGPYYHKIHIHCLLMDWVVQGVFSQQVY